MVQSSLSSYYMNYNGSKFCVSVKLRAFFYCTKKPHELNHVVQNWPTRIRTLKMLESESSALPFGDGPMSRDREYIIIMSETMQALFLFFFLSC
jgi:hypothetical protein